MAFFISSKLFKEFYSFDMPGFWSGMDKIEKETSFKQVNELI